MMLCRIAWSRVIGRFGAGRLGKSEEMIQNEFYGIISGRLTDSFGW
jgi:hypothetical protein